MNQAAQDRRGVECAADRGHAGSRASRLGWDRDHIIGSR